MAKETKQPLISIVDDEACVREALTSLMRSVGFKAEDFTPAEEFLNSRRVEETVG